jgi:putative hydrolase of the HAD superfamily
VIRMIFLDVGGVLLSNAWDGPARARAIQAFGLDAAELEQRHEESVAALEIGRMTLDAYLERVVFHRPRTFSRAAFVAFMQAQSTAIPEALALARQLAHRPGPLLCTLNNESRELNRYRIDTFGLRELFRAFFSSCYLGVAKPDDGIYRATLDLTQLEPGECLLLDDRAENVAAAAALGWRAERCADVTRLRAALAEHGIEPPAVDPTTT